MFKLENHLQSKCSGISSFKVQNSEGKTVGECQYWEPRELGAIDISKYASGLYMIYFKCSSGFEYQMKFDVVH